MEIHSFDLMGILQYLLWLNICDIVFRPLICDAVIVLNEKKRNVCIKAWKGKNYCIYSINVTLNGLISPGGKEQGMGQDLKFSLLKCCCLIIRKWHLFIVNMTWGVFTYLWRQTWLQCARAQSSTTHRESASSLSFRVWAWEFWCVWPYSLLPASTMSDLTIRPAATHSNTLVLNRSFYMLSGLRHTWHQTRGKLWNNVIPLQTWNCACSLSLLWLNSE